MLNQISTYQYNSTSNSRGTYLGYFAWAGDGSSLPLGEGKKLAVGGMSIPYGPTGWAPIPWLLCGGRLRILPPAGTQFYSNSWGSYLSYFAGAGGGSSLQLGEGKVHNATLLSRQVLHL